MANSKLSYLLVLSTLLLGAVRATAQAPETFYPVDVKACSVEGAATEPCDIDGVLATRGPADEMRLLALRASGSLDLWIGGKLFQDFCADFNGYGVCRQHYSDDHGGFYYQGRIELSRWDDGQWTLTKTERGNSGLPWTKNVTLDFAAPVTTPTPSCAAEIGLVCPAGQIDSCQTHPTITPRRCVSAE